MININFDDREIVVTVHDDGGGASEFRLCETPGHLEIVAEVAESVSAVVTVNGATQTVEASG